jgi:gamma-butyrobetaine dioxygenase
MNATDLSVGAHALDMRWADGTNSSYPYIWLRDNCPSGLHPQTRERMSDLLAIDPEPRPRQACIEGGTAVVEWADDHVSRFPLDWLSEYRPGRRRSDAAEIAPTIWRSELKATGVPRHKAAAILADDGALQAWMLDTARLGLTIVEGVEGIPAAGVAIAERIGFLRRTNFGTTFEVVNRPDPNNLAFTSERLPLHTDLPNQEVPPGYQFLHCIANEAEGGGSLFADGFAIAEDLRREEPEAFRLLADVAIPFRFHDAVDDIRVHRPVITLDGEGRLVEIRYNAHICSVFDMPADIMPAYYWAYRAFMRRTRQEAYPVTMKLKAGEMVAFDNRRILHGRDRFDPNTGFRHLHGCYVDRGEFDSRLRFLARAEAEAPVAMAAAG